jgi:hypothetical protein
MVYKENLKLFSLHIQSTKHCKKWIKDEKIMAPKVHGVQKFLKPHKTPRNRSPNTQTLLESFFVAFIVPR